MHRHLAAQNSQRGQVAAILKWLQIEQVAFTKLRELMQPVRPLGHVKRNHVALQRIIMLNKAKGAATATLAKMAQVMIDYFGRQGADEIGKAFFKND